MKMSEIKAIVFDLGRVLVDVDITRGIFGLFGHSTTNGKEAAVAQMMREPIYAEYNAGKMTPERFYAAVKKKFSFEINFVEFARQWCDVFAPMDGMYELVKNLHGRVRIGLLSDTDPLHWKYICEQFAIVTLIDRPTLSFETGFRKPAKEAYLSAVRNVGVVASQCLYIDDLMENVLGAMDAGLEAIQFTSANALRQEMRIREIITS